MNKYNIVLRAPDRHTKWVVEADGIYVSGNWAVVYRELKGDSSGYVSGLLCRHHQPVVIIPVSESWAIIEMESARTVADESEVE